MGKFTDLFKTKKRLACERDWAYTQLGIWRDSMSLVDSEAIKKLLSQFKEPLQVKHFEGDDTYFDMTISNYGTALFARCFLNQLDSVQAENYLTMTFWDERGGKIEVTIRRHNGKTPADTIAELKQKIADLEATAPTRQPVPA